MGKPAVANPQRPYAHCVSGPKPAEVKHFSKRRKREQLFIPLVAASEEGRAQTLSLCLYRVQGVVGLSFREDDFRRMTLERAAKEGNSPVIEKV